MIPGKHASLYFIVDNVPLEAAAQGMYDLTHYPTGHYFWEFLAYCTGTGGSVIIIYSGVAAMGLEKINLFCYFKKMSWFALIGFFSGAVNLYTSESTITLITDENLCIPAQSVR